MRKIINNKVYDTHTARECGRWDNGLEWMDLRYEAETLYRKKTGEYFLLMEGGAGTRYAKIDGPNSWVGGELIVPVSYEDAKEWATRRLDAEDWAAEFGEPTEGEAVVCATISAAAKARLDRERSQSGETVAQVLERAIAAL